MPAGTFLVQLIPWLYNFPKALTVKKKFSKFLP